MCSVLLSLELENVRNRENTEKERDYSKTWYHTDLCYRKKVKESKIAKYSDNIEYREKAKIASVTKYHCNANRKQSVKQASINKTTSTIFR